MEQLMGQISQEILDVGNLAAGNLSTVETSLDSALSEMKGAMKNSSNAFDNNLSSLKMKTKRLEDQVAMLFNFSSWLFCFREPAAFPARLKFQLYPLFVVDEEAK
jgi:hypothetical protein